MIIPIVITKEIDVIPALLTVCLGDGIGKEPSIDHTDRNINVHKPTHISKYIHLSRQQNEYTAYG